MYKINWKMLFMDSVSVNKKFLSDRTTGKQVNKVTNCMEQEPGPCSMHLEPDYCFRLLELEIDR